jgi:Secretion system C-terminal sorting domain
MHNTATWRTFHPSAGMLLESNINLGLKCNNITRTVNGFYIVGDNVQLATSNANITFNNLNANYYPWYCADVTPGTNYGTFGDVGSPTIECGNQFVNGMDLRRQIGLNKVDIFRQTSCTAFLSNVIHTDASLTLLAKSHPAGATRYDVLNTTNPINDPCANNANKQALIDNGNTIDETVREDREDDVIVDDVAFTPVDELMNWMDDWKLYSQLDMDANRRINHANLMAFYNLMQTKNLGKIYEIDKKISILQLDTPAVREDWINNMYQTMYTHSTIIANNDWEQAYLDVQAVQLQAIQYGLANVSEPELETISTIANSCIYEKGLAVQQARALYNTINPGVHFNDYYICSPNANRSASAETEYEGEFEKTDFAVSVYPIPAKDIINFEYLCPLSEGKLYIYNTLGEQIATQQLAKGLRKATVEVGHIPNGIYTYKIVFANCGTNIGKFNIIH